MKPRIHYTKPSIAEMEICYATDAAANGLDEKCYEYINRFEGAFRPPPMKAVRHYCFRS